MAIFTPTQNKQETTVFPTGVSTNLHESQNTVANPIEQAPIFTYTVTPLDSDNGRCVIVDATVAASIQPGVSLPLYTQNTNIFQGNQCFIADCERGLSIEFSANPTQATTAFIYGYDYRGVQVAEQITITTASNAFISAKQYSYVYSIYFLANPGRDLVVVCNNQFGMPHYVPDSNYVLSIWVGNVKSPLTDFGAGYNWRNGAFPPSLTTSSTRGYVNVLPLDGSTPLVVTYYVQGEDSSVQSSLLNEATIIKQQINSSTTSTIDVVRVQTSVTTRQLVMPTLLSYDTYGVQYPGNADFIDTYVKLYNS